MMALWVLAFLFLACQLTKPADQASQPNPPTKPVEVNPTGINLLGEWGEKKDSGIDSGTYTFLNTGEYIRKWISKDTKVYGGKYWIVDSMLHFVEFKDAAPREEIWGRMVYMNDSLHLYKGILLEGNSNSLFGTWKYESALKDSAGSPYIYKYEFLEPGTLIASVSGLYSDTSHFRWDEARVNTTDIKTGKEVFSLGYRVYANKLTIYNLNAKMTLVRLRPSRR